MFLTGYSCLNMNLSTPDFNLNSKINLPYCRNSGNILILSLHGLQWEYLNEFLLHEESSTAGLRFCWWVPFGGDGTQLVPCHHGVITAAVTTGKLLHCLHVQMKCQERSHLIRHNNLFLLPNIETMFKKRTYLIVRDAPDIRLAGYPAG
jgi:hypothetical protein